MQRLATMNSGSMKFEKMVIKNQVNGSISFSSQRDTATDKQRFPKKLMRLKNLSVVATEFGVVLRFAAN